MLYQADLLNMVKLKNEINTVVDALMLQSLDEHFEILGMLKSLQQEIDMHSLAYIEKFNTRFYLLQQQSRETDKKLFEQLPRQDIPENIGQQLDRRKSMQQDILDLLKKTVPKANSVKSLMASEIQDIKHGRKALNGYKTQTNHQGKILNRTL